MTDGRPGGTGTGPGAAGNEPARTGGRLRRPVAGLLAAGVAAALLAGCGGDASPEAKPAPVPAGPSATADGRDGDAPGGDASRSPEAAGGSEGADGSAAADATDVAPLPSSPPVRVRIPSLGVDSTLERLGKESSGAMETPKDHERAGWYEPGPAPGARGPSVLAGHVTWNGAKSVFFELGTLKQGATVEVERQDGKTVTFRVDAVERYPKDEFPTVKVYRNLDHAGLRLITCGGEFSPERHHYADNVVAYATMTGVSPS